MENKKINLRMVAAVAKGLQELRSTRPFRLTSCLLKMVR